MASEVIFTQFVVTRVLHTARISNVESTVCDNKERKMVNFRNKLNIPSFSFLSEFKIYHLSLFFITLGDNYTVKQNN